MQLERDQVRPADANNSGISTAINDTVSERIVKPDLPCAFERRRRAFRALQELVVESAERQRVADCGVGRAGSPSRPVAGWQPGSRRAARRSAPTTSLQSRPRHPFARR
jgi:hypothetical protein